MGRRSDIDWDAIERDYRLGNLSLRQIAISHKVNASAISRRASKWEWVQDKSEEVREKTRAALLASEKSNKESNKQRNAPTPGEVDAAVATNVQIVREHRGSIGRGQKLVNALFGELEDATDNRDEIEAAIKDETADDQNGKRRAMMIRAVALPSRSGVIVNLSSALKTLVAIERQAFNLDDSTGEKDLAPASAAHDLSGLSDDDLESIERIVAKVAAAQSDQGGEAT